VFKEDKYTHVTCGGGYMHGQTKAWLLHVQGEEVPAYTAEVSLLFGSRRLAEVVVVVDVVVVDVVVLAVAIPHDAHRKCSLYGMCSL
jgi:hypothetical protein